MKKFLTLLFALLSTIGMKADVLAELTFPGSNDKGVSAYQTEWTATNDNGTWSIVNFNNNNNDSKWTYIRCGWKTAATTSSIATPAIEGAITDLVVAVDKTSNVTSAKLQVIQGGSVVNTINVTNWEAGDVKINVTAESGSVLKLVLENEKTSANGTTQISKITVNGTPNTAGGDPVAVESVSLTDDKGNAMGMYQSLVQGESLQLKAVVAPSNATNKNVTWEVMQNENVISLENGLVKALAPGQAAVVVTTEDGEYQAAVTIYVTEPQPSTIADFIANEGGTCYLTGVVSNITNTTYGNFDLTDETGTIYVFGCLTPAGEQQQFESLGIAEGDKITVLASEYQLYKNKTCEAVNVVFVENHGSTPTYTFNVVAGAETFTVTPSDNDVQYYVEVQPAGLEEAVKEFGFETVEDYFDYLCEEMGDGLECFSGVSTQSYEEDWYIDEPGDYSVYVFAVNGDYERASELTIVPFSAASMTVTEAGYATFAAPFEVAVPTGVKAYTVEGVEGETLTLTSVSTIAANTPVVLEGALDATLLCGKAVEGTPKAGLLTGVYEETEAPVGSYVLQNLEAGVGFYKVAEGQQPTVGINRAYLTTESSVKAFSLADATAIKSLEALTAGKAQIFDMNGRQINKLQKGINIVNGVKVLVK